MICIINPLIYISKEEEQRRDHGIPVKKCPQLTGFEDGRFLPVDTCDMRSNAGSTDLWTVPSWVFLEGIADVLCTPGIFCDEPISMTHNSSSLISYLIWRSKDTRFTFYFLSGCYLHDETLMMERFTDRWIQHYFSYHKCPPVRTFRLQTLWAVDTSLQECHGLFQHAIIFV